MSYETAARRSYKAFEPYSTMVYFAPEAITRFKSLGLNRRQGYLCSRSAALGRAPVQVVAAAFYNFNPAYLAPLLENGWQATDPETVLAERYKLAHEVAHRLMAPGEGQEDFTPQIERAFELVRQATANLHPGGRVMFGALQALPWPDESFTALWHGINMLREYRADCHFAALLAHGLEGVDSLLLQSVYSKRATLEFLIGLTGWDEAAVKAGYARLREQGLMDENGLTPAGRELREAVEQATDRADTPPFRQLGQAGSEELLDLMTTLGRRVLERGGAPA